MFGCTACGVRCASCWGDCAVQVLTYFELFCINYLLPSLSLRLLLLSIAIGALDLDDRMVFL